MKKILFVGAVIVIAIGCSINLYISNKNGDKLGSSIYLKNIEMLASAECNCGTGCRWKILEGQGTASLMEMGIAAFVDQQHIHDFS
jgi:hypothetical protein